MVEKVHCSVSPELLQSVWPLSSGLVLADRASGLVACVLAICRGCVSQRTCFRFTEVDLPSVRTTSSPHHFRSFRLLPIHGWGGSGRSITRRSECNLEHCSIVDGKPRSMDCHHRFQHEIHHSELPCMWW